MIRVFQRCALSGVVVVLLASLASGCATIVHGDHENVYLEGVRDSLPKVSRLTITRTLDSVPVRNSGLLHGHAPFVRIESTARQTLLIDYAGHTDTVRFVPRLDMNYVVADLILAPGTLLLAPIIDLSTESWLGFHNDRLRYDPSGNGPRWTAIESEPPAGIIIGGYWGVNWPVVQTPILGNALSGFVGYEFAPSIDAVIAYDAISCTTLENITGAYQPATAECDMGARVWSLGVRTYPVAAAAGHRPDAIPEYLYLYGGGALAMVSGSTLMTGEAGPLGAQTLDHPWTRTIPSIAFGVGVGTTIAIDLRWTIGLKRIEFYPGSSGDLRFGSCRIGLSMLL